MQLDRTLAPATHDPIEFDYQLPPINKSILNNGLTLYWLNAGVQDVVEVNWIFPAGIWYENKHSIAHTTSALLKNGTSKYSAHQISEAFEFYGASLKTNAGNDLASVTLHTLTKHLSKILP